MLCGCSRTSKSETGLLVETFPKLCIYSAVEVLDSEFLPDFLPDEMIQG